MENNLCMTVSHPSPMLRVYLPNGFCYLSCCSYGCYNLRTLKNLCIGWSSNIQFKFLEINYELWENTYGLQSCIFLYSPPFSESYNYFHEDSEYWWGFKMNGNSVFVTTCKQILKTLCNFCMWILPAANPLQQFSWTQLPTTLQTSSSTVDS